MIVNVYFRTTDVLIIASIYDPICSA